MQRRIVVLCALFATFATMAQAQFSSTPPAPQNPGNSFTIKCGGYLVVQQITSTWNVGTINCTTTATVNEVPFQGLTFSETHQTAPTQINVWGVIVGTLTNGDQVYFDYHNVWPVRNGVAGAGTMTYKIVGGTGSANGATGAGTCLLPTASTGGVTQLTCTGNSAAH